VALFRLATYEIRVEVGPLEGTGSNPVKAPHIELPLETLVLGLVKVFGHDLFVKVFCFVDLEAILGRNPRHNIAEALGLCVVQDAVKLPWKANLGSWLLLLLVGLADALALASLAMSAVIALFIEDFSYDCLARILPKAILTGHDRGGNRNRKLVAICWQHD